MQISYAVFSRTNLGIEYTVKLYFKNRQSAYRWVKKHQNDQTDSPYYSPEGSLTSLKYINGLFVKKIEGIIQSGRTGVTTEKNNICGIAILPGETKEIAMRRINSTPHYHFKLEKIY